MLPTCRKQGGPTKRIPRGPLISWLTTRLFTHVYDTSCLLRTAQGGVDLCVVPNFPAPAPPAVVGAGPSPRTALAEWLWPLPLLLLLPLPGSLAPQPHCAGPHLPGVLLTSWLHHHGVSVGGLHGGDRLASHTLTHSAFPVDSSRHFNLVNE